jgi:hypothetical protein
MNFEQWKLSREFEKQAGTESFYEKLRSTNEICVLFLAVSVLILVMAAVFLFAL